MTVTLKMAKNTDDITYPVNMREYLPLTDEQVEQVRGILDDEADEILGPKGAKSPSNVKEAYKLAAFRLIQWYNEAQEDEPNIRRLGVIHYIRTYRQARVWASLAGLKNNGVENLPL